MTRENIYYIDGRFVPAGQASLPLDDLALLRGYGVFDFIRTYGGRPFMLEEHILRLQDSARMIRLPLPWTRGEVSDIVRRTLEKNPDREANIRVIVTGGPSPDFLMPTGRPRLLVLVSPLKSYPPQWYERGVKVITVRGGRSIPSAKTLNYLSAVAYLKEAAGSGAVEAILVDPDGIVREGQTVSVFIWLQDRLVTNQAGVLPGVTRALILQLAASVFPIEIRDFTLAELLNADEVFMTATNKEVVPIVRIDETPVADSLPGERTKKIMKIFADFTARFAAGQDIFPTG